MVTIDTELFHILYIDHAGGMVMSGTGHIANLGPGVGGRVKLENSGQGVVTIVSPLVRMDELRMQSNGLMVEILCEYSPVQMIWLLMETARIYFIARGRGLVFLQEESPSTRSSVESRRSRG